jgi:hypothetical protein
LRTGSGFSSKPSISLGAIVATFRFGLGDEVGDSCGVGVGVSVGLGDGVRDDFFRFGLGVSSSSEAGVGELLRLRGGGDFEDVPGDGVGVELLFPAEGLCRRWLGVGVGVAKNFLIFSPNQGSAVRPSGVDAREKRKTKSNVPTDSRFVRFGL